MNKKLKSLILSGVLAVSMISTPTFATNNGEQGPTLTTKIAEVPKEEPLSEEEVHGDDEPSDDEIPETDASEEDETDDPEATPTESETPPDTIEPVEKVEAEKETVDEPAEDEEPEEPQTEGDLDDKGPALYSTRVPIGDANKNLNIDGKEFKNAYRGQFWVNGSYNGETKDGIIQRRYVDHIDIRVSDATIKIKHLVNGEFQNTETVTGANVVSVQRVLINDKDLKYHSTKKRYEENPQFGTAGLEFNFQIAKLDTFTYSEWLDLTTVNKISFVCTLEGYLNGKKQTFENVTITINGIDDIVGKSYCSNASGLDYYVSGEVSDDIIIEIPFVPEGIDINLTPGTGDISIYRNLYCLVFALAILVSINKKIIKIKGE